MQTLYSSKKVYYIDTCINKHTCVSECLLVSACLLCTHCSSRYVTARPGMIWPASGYPGMASDMHLATHCSLTTSNVPVNNACLAMLHVCPQTATLDSHSVLFHAAHDASYITSKYCKCPALTGCQSFVRQQCIQQTFASQAPLQRQQRAAGH